MIPLTLRGPARAAAWHLLEHTTLGPELAAHVTDDGAVLTVAVDADDWGRLSSGERALYGLLEMLAHRHSTTTLHDMERLDAPCREAVVDALGIVLQVERGAA